MYACVSLGSTAEIYGIVKSTMPQFKNTTHTHTKESGNKNKRQRLFTELRRVMYLRRAETLCTRSPPNPKVSADSGTDRPTTPRPAASFPPGSSRIPGDALPSSGRGRLRPAPRLPPSVQLVTLLTSWPAGSSWAGRALLCRKSLSSHCLPARPGCERSGRGMNRPNAQLHCQEPRPKEGDLGGGPGRASEQCAPPTEMTAPGSPGGPGQPLSAPGVTGP